MNPKEKAEELVSNYLWPQRAFNELAKRKVASECAIICVDEILNAVTTIADKKYEYWLEVKTEIEKL